MTAAMWTAIGLLAATSLGTLFYLGNRIDTLGSSLGSRIDGLGPSLNARIDALAESLGGRIDSLESRMESKFDVIEGRLDSINVRIDAHVQRHAS